MFGSRSKVEEAGYLGVGESELADEIGMGPFLSEVDGGLKDDGRIKRKRK